MKRGNMKKCIIYSAFGNKCLNQAAISAKAAKYNIKEDISLILHTEECSILTDGHQVFDKILRQKKPEALKHKFYGFKIKGMIEACKRLNFDYFLFLDTDAVIQKAEALEIFDLLKHFDIAAAHAPVRISPFAGELGEDPLIPRCFPEFNSGVIVFKKSCMPVFEEWLNLYLSKPVIPDQPAFRKIIYFSNLRVATLTPEYNHRGNNLTNCFIWHNDQAVEHFKKKHDQS